MKFCYYFLSCFFIYFYSVLPVFSLPILNVAIIVFFYKTFLLFLFSSGEKHKCEPDRREGGAGERLGGLLLRLPPLLPRVQGGGAVGPSGHHEIRPPLCPGVTQTCK